MEGVGASKERVLPMSIQRLVLVALITGVFGAAPAFAQTSPLNIDRATRVSSRNVAAAPPVAAVRPRAPNRYGDGQLPPPVGFLEMLFGGLSQATAPQYQFDPLERTERGTAY